jgi:hypothetical protein
MKKTKSTEHPSGEKQIVSRQEETEKNPGFGKYNQGDQEKASF